MPRKRKFTLALPKELAAENNSLNDEAESSTKVLARTTLQSNRYENNEQEPLEESSPIPAKATKITRVTRKNIKKQNNEPEPLEESSPIPTKITKVSRIKQQNNKRHNNEQQQLKDASSLVNNETTNSIMAKSTQNTIINLIPTQNYQESSAISLLNDNNEATSSVFSMQDQMEPFILSDEEETSSVDQNQQMYDIAGSSNTSVVTLTNKNNSRGMQFSQGDHCIQELFQKKSQEIAIEIDSPSKQPTPFQKMSNEFEIAYWLAHHKSILDLAVNIRNGIMNKTNEGCEPTSISTSSQHYRALPQQFSFESVPTPPEINQHIKFQLQEECKALFLRTRNNTVALYEELVVRVCKITKTDPRLGTLVKDVGGWYNNYRHKFHVAVVKLAGDFITTHERIKEPYNELDEFITEEIWKQSLQMHLKATDQPNLRKNSLIITKLGIFVRMVVKMVLIAMRAKEDTQLIIKKCDEVTIDLEIPTKLGIVRTLPVRELLDY